MADVICQKCGYTTDTKEEDTERGSTCPICRGELKVKFPNKACGCIFLIIIILVIAATLWRFQVI